MGSNGTETTATRLPSYNVDNGMIKSKKSPRLDKSGKIAPKKLVMQESAKNASVGQKVSLPA